MVIERLERAGPVRYGSFALEEEEAARRGGSGRTVSRGRLPFQLLRPRAPVPLPSILLALSLVQSPPPSPHPDELARWQRHARAVRITRDDWGIAHVHGTTDADAVFGMIYAQAEDDFDRDREELPGLHRSAGRGRG